MARQTKNKDTAVLRNEKFFAFVAVQTADETRGLHKNMSC